MYVKSGNNLIKQILNSEKQIVNLEKLFEKRGPRKNFWLENILIKVTEQHP